MPLNPDSDQYKWLNAGEEIFPALLAAIESAKISVRLEVYIFAEDEIGRRFRDALLESAKRGVRTRVMIDALGSLFLPAGFWDEAIKSGVEFKLFNPFWLNRIGVRDHRKLLVCDDEWGFVGGFNMADEYNGDGVKSGWCELGIQFKGALVKELADAFDEIFKYADTFHPKLGNRAHPETRKEVSKGEGTLLLGGPGFFGNPFKVSFGKDLKRARNVDVICPYFLPTSRIRRRMIGVARRGGRVRLLMPEKSDVTLSQLAAQSLYRKLLRAGIKIYRYQPQVLHAKLMIVDHLAYVGSSNLDPRSLLINYELMVRLTDQRAVYEARQLFEQKLGFSKQLFLSDWVTQRTWWKRMKCRWAYFLISKIDPFVAGWFHSRDKRH